MTTEERTAQLLAELTWWRARAERLEEKLRIVAVDAVDAYKQVTGHADAVPPEPPVGTEFWRDDRAVWVRRDDGWHCTRPVGVCTACPASWAEVWDIGGVRRNVTRVWPDTPADEAGDDDPKEGP